MLLMTSCNPQLKFLDKFVLVVRVVSNGIRNLRDFALQGIGASAQLIGLTGRLIPQKRCRRSPMPLVPRMTHSEGYSLFKENYGPLGGGELPVRLGVVLVAADLPGGDFGDQFSCRNTPIGA